MKTDRNPKSEIDDLKPLAFTAEQVARLLGISVRSVWRFSSAGELPSPISIGRSKRWNAQAIENYVHSKAKEKQVEKR